MPGATTGTPIACGLTPDTIPDALQRSCVSLPRYARLIGYDECALYGVNNGEASDCFDIMSESDRDNIAYYLAEALEEIERELKYPLCPTWFTDEEHSWLFPMTSRWGRVISGGVRATDTIASAQGVGYTTEPACVGPIATALTSTEGIKVYYPNSEREIEPESMTLVGGNLTVWIPRCRLVHPDYFDNPENGWDYADLSHFVSSVDVVREYNDTSTNAEFYWPSGNGSCATCAESTQDGCITVRNGRIGEMGVMPATYSAGAWNRSSILCTRCRPQFVRLNYYAGELQVPLTLENSIVRLAHAKMPMQPCAGCDYTRNVWSRDRIIMEPVTNEQVMNPFGRTEGALTAWRYVRANRLVRGFTL